MIASADDTETIMQLIVNLSKMPPKQWSVKIEDVLVALLHPENAAKNEETEGEH